jgi:hypothetical protein
MPSQNIQKKFVETDSDFANVSMPENDLIQNVTHLPTKACPRATESTSRPSMSYRKSFERGCRTLIRTLGHFCSRLYVNTADTHP